MELHRIKLGLYNWYITTRLYKRFYSIRRWLRRSKVKKFAEIELKLHKDDMARSTIHDRDFYLKEGSIYIIAYGRQVIQLTVTPETSGILIGMGFDKSNCRRRVDILERLDIGYNKGRIDNENFRLL